MNEVKIYAQTRHYASLDGLRGFAAVSVVFYHLGHWLNMPVLATNSGLAVDLFFCLSGYVLPRAYERRIAQFSIPQMMRLRLARLMPLILLALLISATYVISKIRKLGGQEDYYPIYLSTIFGIFNIPYFGAPKIIGGPEIFPLNGPQYTLFLELVINIVWWSTRRVNQLRLSVCLSLVCFSFLPFMGLGGDLPETFWSGFPRVGASFFAGVALHQIDKNLPPWPAATGIFWFLCAIMVVLFYMPIQAPLPLELVWVAVLSPLLVINGTRVALSPSLTSICVAVGALSYPIYCLHYPVFEWVNGVYRSRMGSQNIVVEGSLTFVSVLAVSYAALKLWDEPVRRLIAARRG